MEVAVVTILAVLPAVAMAAVNIVMMTKGNLDQSFVSME